ncbi:MAG: hypothetical protein ACYC64_16915 [Armatimonadota bacterium]
MVKWGWKQVVLVLVALMPAAAFLYAPFVKGIQLSAREQAMWNFLALAVSVLLAWYFAVAASKREAANEVRATARSAMRRVYEVMTAAQNVFADATAYCDEADDKHYKARLNDIVHQIRAIECSLGGFESDWKEILAEDLEKQYQGESKMLSSLTEIADLNKQLSTNAEDLEKVAIELEQEKGEKAALEKEMKDLKDQNLTLQNRIAKEREKATVAQREVPFAVGTATAMASIGAAARIVKTHELMNEKQKWLVGPLDPYPCSLKGPGSEHSSYNELPKERNSKTVKNNDTNN